MATAGGGRRVGDRLPWLVLLLALAMTTVWVVPVVLTRAHGFDISDEGSYVLSYRWWDADTRNFTGAQYLYGPVFEALDYSLGALRLVRLGTVLGAHAVFGWAFVSWLRTRWPSLLPTRAWAAAVIACVVAVGGVTYGWLPLSPGYDDVVALGCLVVMAAMFRSWRAVLLTGRLAVGPALALPAPVLAMLLAKWSSTVVVMAFLVVVFLVVALALRAGGWGRFLGAGLVCTGVVVLLFDVVVEPLGRVVPPLVEVNRLAAGSSHSAGTLLHLYLSSTLGILERTTPLVLIMAVLGVVALVVARSRMRRAAPGCGRGAGRGSRPGGRFRAEPARGGGRPGRLRGRPVALVAGAAVVCGGRWCAHPGADRPRRGSALELAGVASMLVLVPVVQAIGSANSLSSLAVNLAASWFAFVLLCVAAARGLRSSRWFLVSAALAMLVLCPFVAADGVLLHPYRTTASTRGTAHWAGRDP